MWIVLWKRHVPDIDNVGTCTFAFHVLLHAVIPSFLRSGQNWYVTSKAVIPRHAWVGNSTSRIWGTDKRSKTSSELLHEAFPQSNPSLAVGFNEWRATGNCLYCRATSPAFQSTHRNHSSGRSRVLPAYDRPPLLYWWEMRRNETSNDDLLRTTLTKRRFVTR